MMHAILGSKLPWRVERLQVMRWWMSSSTIEVCMSMATVHRLWHIWIERMVHWWWNHVFKMGLSKTWMIWRVMHIVLWHLMHHWVDVMIATMFMTLEYLLYII